MQDVQPGRGLQLELAPLGRWLLPAWLAVHARLDRPIEALLADMEVYLADGPAGLGCPVAHGLGLHLSALLRLPGA